MKKNILFFVSGVAVTMCFAATNGESIFTLKPAKPSSVATNEFYYSSGAVAFIREKVAAGFQLKAVTSASEKSSYIVVMEKY